MADEKLIVIAGPSGAGKTTLAHELIDRYEELEFCISATTRTPRNNETSGKDYHFFSEKDFRDAIHNEEFAEYEEVFQDIFYGTPKSELQRIWEKGHYPVLDIDVKGAFNIRKRFPDQGLFIFIHPGDENHLWARLQKRHTESSKKLQERIKRSKEEIAHAPRFDHVIYNDDLEKAKGELLSIVQRFLGLETVS